MRTILISFAFALIAQLAHAATITIRADELNPVNGDPGAKDGLGLFIDLANAIFSNAGHDVDYRQMSWEAALAATTKGDVDCVVGAYKKDAPTFVYPDQPWAIMQDNLFVRKGRNFSYNKPDDLKDLRLAYVPDYALSDEIDAYIKANIDNPDRIVELPAQKRALRNGILRVSVGQIDAIVETDVVMAATLKRMNMVGQLTSVASLGEPSETFIACSPAKPSSNDYVELVNQTIPLMRASGDLQRIYDKYGVTPPQ